MKNKPHIAVIAAAVCLLICSVKPGYSGNPNKMYLFAAASTTNAVNKISRLYEKDHTVEIVLCPASSSTLAKQIYQGAPAGLFISANPQWMDFLAKQNRLLDGSRIDLLGNQLVLIAPLDSRLELTIEKKFDLANALGSSRLAMGDPDHVPAGIYGKRALEHLGVWPEVAPKVVRAKDVRAAMVLVERAEAPLGIVYATDAAMSKKVKVIDIFPEETHPRIIYPAALVSGQNSEIPENFLSFLKTPKAKEIFESFGFFVR